MEVYIFGLIGMDGNVGLQILLDQNGQKWMETEFPFLFFCLAITEIPDNRHLFNGDFQTIITLLNDTSI